MAHLHSLTVCAMAKLGTVMADPSERARPMTWWWSGAESAALQPLIFFDRAQVKKRGFS